MSGCAVSADGRTGLSGFHRHRTLIVWDLASGDGATPCAGHEDRVNGCAVRADGRTGLSASYDRTLIVWDLASGEQRHTLRGHQGRVNGCAVSARTAAPGSPPPMTGP